MQAYSNPKRESDPYSLPDVEVFYLTADEQAQQAIENDDEVIYDVAANAGQTEEFENGWFWWTCLPGCLPDGPAIGPFETQAEALADAREGMDEEEL
jgi:hypothetical protein